MNKRILNGTGIRLKISILVALIFIFGLITQLNAGIANFQITVGYKHVCALDDNGVTCWGNNGLGQIDVPSLSNPIQVSAGYYHTCAVDDYGVTCWGENKLEKTSVPSLSSPKQVSAGDYHTCAIDNNGVTCWGSNYYGETNVPSLSNPIQVTAGEDHTCALDDNGVTCWGRNDYGEIDVPSLSNPTQVTAGRDHTCALDDNGMTCWGDKSWGLADVPSLSNPIQVSAGYSPFICALDDNGVTCWGYNDKGQTDVPNLTNPKQVTAGGTLACALDDNGVTCWGNNADGQTDVPNLNFTFPSPTPTPTPTTTPLPIEITDENPGVISLNDNYDITLRNIFVNGQALNVTLEKYTNSNDVDGHYWRLKSYEATETQLSDSFVDASYNIDLVLMLDGVPYEVTLKFLSNSNRNKRNSDLEWQLSTLSQITDPAEKAKAIYIRNITTWKKSSLQDADKIALNSLSYHYNFTEADKQTLMDAGFSQSVVDDIVAKSQHTPESGEMPLSGTKITLSSPDFIDGGEYSPNYLAWEVDYFTNTKLNINFVNQASHLVYLKSLEVSNCENIDPIHCGTVISEDKHNSYNKYGVPLSNDYRYALMPHSNNTDKSRWDIYKDNNTFVGNSSVYDNANAASILKSGSHYYSQSIWSADSLNQCLPMKFSFDYCYSWLTDEGEVKSDCPEVLNVSFDPQTQGNTLNLDCCTTDGAKESQSCSITNGSGEQERVCGDTLTKNWGEYGECKVQYCNTGYTKNTTTNACDKDAECSTDLVESCTTSTGSGTKTLQCYNGQYSNYWSSCKLSSCASGYTLINGECVKNEECTRFTYDYQSCTISNGSGRQSRYCGNDAQWGSWSSCEVTSCNTGYIESSSGLSCVEEPTSDGIEGEWCREYQGQPYQCIKISGSTGTLTKVSAGSSSWYQPGLDLLTNITKTGTNTYTADLKYQKTTSSTFKTREITLTLSNSGSYTNYTSFYMSGGDWYDRYNSIW